MVEVISLNMFSKNNLILTVVFVLFVFSGPFFTWAANPGLSPFGGVITIITPCNCNPDRVMIQYSRVRSVMPEYLTFSYSSSKLYEYATIRTGAHILGETISPDVCLYGSHCHAQATELIGIMGTSR